MAKAKQLKTEIWFGAKVDPSVRKACDNITKAYKSLNAGVNTAIKGISVATAAVATAVSGATAALYKMGSAWHSAEKAIRIGTGATGKDMEALSTSLQKVYNSVPAEMGAVANTIADLNTLTGATGETLENFARSALQAAHILGSDAKSVYEPAAKAMNAFNIPVEQAAEKMDWLWKVSQSTGAGISALAEAARTGQNAFRSLGFSFEEATALVGQMDKAGLKGETAIAALNKAVQAFASSGAKDYGKAFKAIAKRIKTAKNETEAITIATATFGKRGGAEMAKAIREGKLSVDAFVASLRTSNETIASAFSDTSAAGDKLSVVWHKVMSALKPAADAVFQSINRFIPILDDAISRAMPTLEQLARDLSAEVQKAFSALAEWAQSIDFDSVASSLKEAYETVKGWATAIVDNIGTIKAWAKGIGIATAAIKGVSVAIDGVKLAMGVWTTGKTLTKGFIALLSLTKAALVAMVANPIGLIVTAIGAAVAAGWWLYKNWDEVCSWCSEMWQSFSDMFPKTAKFIETCWKALCAEFEIAWELVKAGLLASWENIKLTWDVLCSTLKMLWDNFSAAFSAVVKLVSGDFEGAKNDIMRIWTNLTEWFNGTLARFSEYSDAIKNIYGSAWENIKEIAKGVIDSIMEYIQPLIDAIKGIFDVLGNVKDGIKNAVSGAWDGVKGAASGAWEWVKGKFAAGGFTNGPSLCGEAGTEAVISFDPAYRAQNQSYLMTAAEMLGMTAAPAASRVESRATTFNLGGITFSPVIKAGSSAQASSIMKQLKSSIPDLVDAIEQELAKRQSTRYA